VEREREKEGEREREGEGEGEREGEWKCDSVPDGLTAYCSSPVVSEVVLQK
jgi:hypothetical protein